MESENGSKWFCEECTALLGIKQEDQVQIRFKQEINLTVRGRIIMTCRRCGAINQMDTERAHQD